MKKFIILAFFLSLAVPVFAQSNDVTVDRFTVNQSATLNSFQSPQYLYGNVELTFSEDVTMIEVSVRVRDGYGKPVDGASVSKSWPSASANQDIEYDYTYYNPSAIQEFKPVLVVTAKGADGKHIQQTFNPIGQ